MTPSHRAALTAIWGHLEQYLLNHGIRLVAAIDRVEELPTPAAVITLGSFTLPGEGRALAEWDLGAIALGRDAFEAAAVLDALEAACHAWQQRGDTGAHIRALRYLGHEEMELGVGVVAARATFRALIVRT